MEKKKPVKPSLDNIKFTSNSEEVNSALKDCISLFGLEEYCKVTSVEERFRELRKVAVRHELANVTVLPNSLVVDVPPNGDCLFSALLAFLLGRKIFRDEPVIKIFKTNFMKLILQNRKKIACEDYSTPKAAKDSTNLITFDHDAYPGCCSLEGSENPYHGRTFGLIYNTDLKWLKYRNVDEFCEKMLLPHSWGNDTLLKLFACFTGFTVITHNFNCGEVLSQYFINQSKPLFGFKEILTDGEILLQWRDGNHFQVLVPVGPPEEAKRKPIIRVRGEHSLKDLLQRSSTSRETKVKKSEFDWQTVNRTKKKKTVNDKEMKAKDMFKQKETRRFDHKETTEKCKVQEEIEANEKFEKERNKLSDGPKPAPPINKKENDKDAKFPSSFLVKCGDCEDSVIKKNMKRHYRLMHPGLPPRCAGQSRLNFGSQVSSTRTFLPSTETDESKDNENQNHLDPESVKKSQKKIDIRAFFPKKDICGKQHMDTPEKVGCETETEASSMKDQSDGEESKHGTEGEGNVTEGKCDSEDGSDEHSNIKDSGLSEIDKVNVSDIMNCDEEDTRKGEKLGDITDDIHNPPENMKKAFSDAIEETRESSINPEERVLSDECSEESFNTSTFDSGLLSSKKRDRSEEHFSPVRKRKFVIRSDDEEESLTAKDPGGSEVEDSDTADDPGEVESEVEDIETEKHPGENEDEVHEAVEDDSEGEVEESDTAGNAVGSEVEDSDTAEDQDVDEGEDSDTAARGGENGIEESDTADDRSEDEVKDNDTAARGEEDGIEDSDTADNSPPKSVVNDIGKLLNKKGQIAASNLSDAQKYHLLKHHFQPSAKFSFPATQFGNKSRTAGLSNIHGSFVYSKEDDSVWCICCVLFADISKQSMMQSFVFTGFRNWKKITDKQRTHMANKYHQSAHTAAALFISNYEAPEKAVSAQLNLELQSRVPTYKKIITTLAQAVHFCGRQGIALRGHREDLDGGGNIGNYLSLIKLLAEHNEVLKEHVDAVTKKTGHVSYLHPKHQNELIDIIGYQIIQRDLLNEIREAGFHSNLVDECTSFNQEIMSLCFRFVDKKKNIREVFLDFVDAHRTDGLSLFEKVCGWYALKELDIKSGRGQGYDGAKSMSSENVGLGARITEINPKSPFFHCMSHRLNLVIGGACKLLIIQMVIDKMKSFNTYFNTSPKREALLNFLFTRMTHKGRIKVLLSLCKTRWSERDGAYEHFYLAIPSIYEALQVILGIHPKLNEFPDDYTIGWSGEDISKAMEFFKCLCKFDFLIGVVSLYSLLHPLHAITKRLQGRSKDIVQAYEDVEDVKEDVKAIRTNIDEVFGGIYAQACRLADKIDVIPSKPRISGIKSRFRSNVPAEDIEQYFKLNLAIPLVDGVITQLEDRFSDVSRIAVKLLYLVPSMLIKDDFEISKLDDAIQFYEEDIPNKDALSIEVTTWRNRFMLVPKKEVPTTIAGALLVIDEEYFPNLFILLKLVATFPITSSECERSFSTLRRLRTWLRQSMGTQRLGALAIMNSEYDHQVDYDEVAAIFFSLYPRKYEESNLIFNL